MEWEVDALTLIEQIPIPPLMIPLAKMDAELRARKKGLNKVTADTVRETEKGYEGTLGKEAMDGIRAMSRGEEVPLPDEFFVEDPDELYTITLCPIKYGACTTEKKENVKKLLTPLHKKLKQLNTTEIMLSKAHLPLMSHHALRISIIGCSNCCLSPYLSDFGVISVFRPEVTNAACIECGKCITSCSQAAIIVGDGRPAIDYKRCIMCGKCIKECPEGVLAIGKEGYKVVIGGSGSNHPQLAKTVTDFTDVEGVLAILERCLTVFAGESSGNRETAFHKVVRKYGIQHFRIV
jgi:ferredoxin